MIKRMFENEVDTYKLKKQAHILFIHRTNSKSQDRQFGELEKVINRRFTKTEFTHIPSLNSISINDKFNTWKDKDAPFKILVMNDDLFDVNDKNFPKNEAEVETFFDMLNKHHIGLALFGDARVSKLGLEYLAYANNPYSVYTNINNLLKYMNAIKN